MEPIQKQNKTSLRKLKKIILTSILVAVLGLIVFGIGDYTYRIHKTKLERRERIERTVPNHSSLEHMLRERQFLLERIEWMTRANERMGSNLYDREIKRYEQKIRKKDRQIADFKKEIQMKVEKGYLTPDNKQWRYYQKIYRDEPWWPKDVNN